MTKYKPLSDEQLRPGGPWVHVPTAMEQCRRANKLAEASEQLINGRPRTPSNISGWRQAYDEALAAYRGDDDD